MEKEKDSDKGLEERVRLSMLYDFYGALLKDNQQQMFEAYFLEDFSISEIAEDMGITRQGVHDGIKRVSRQLKEYEEKLGLVARFEQQKKKVEELRERVKHLPGKAQEREWKEILELLEEMV